MKSSKITAPKVFVGDASKNKLAAYHLVIYQVRPILNFAERRSILLKLFPYNLCHLNMIFLNLFIIAYGHYMLIFS